MRKDTPASVCSSLMLVIRKAEPRDVPQILQFIGELAEYEKEPHAVVATEKDLLADGFGPSPRDFCLMAEWDLAPAGVPLYFPTHSTWLGPRGVYLADLVVPPPLPGQGIR